MRVVALGGAGAMARRTVKELAAEDDVSEILIADRSKRRAQAFVRELNNPKVRAIKVDASDPEGLKKAIQGYDVVVSGCGPFYKYEVCAAQAAIESGVHYVSLCDDHDAAEKIFDLDPLARRKGLTALTGMGLSPGYSNVLARYGAEILDEVKEINVAWGCSAFDTDGYAAILHTIHIFTGSVPSWQDGQRILVRAGSGGEVVRFPDPMGNLKVFHLGHPEPVTIPRFMKGVNTVTLKGGLAEGYLNFLTKLLARLRLTDTPQKKDRLARIVSAFLFLASRLRGRSETCSGLRVDISGKRKKKDVTLSYGAAAHMDALTGIPMAIGALMLGRGVITRRGVLAPEACVPPRVFLGYMEKRGITTFTGENMDDKLVL